MRDTATGGAKVAAAAADTVPRADGAPATAYEPPAVAWEEPFEPMASMVSCALDSPFEPCASRPGI